MRVALLEEGSGTRVLVVLVLHDGAASTARTAFHAFAVAGPAFLGFFLVDEILRFDRHMHDVRGGPELELAFG